MDLVLCADAVALNAREVAPKLMALLTYFIGVARESRDTLRIGVMVHRDHSKHDLIPAVEVAVLRAISPDPSEESVTELFGTLIELFSSFHEGKKHRDEPYAEVLESLWELDWESEKRVVVMMGYGLPRGLDYKGTYIDWADSLKALAQAKIRLYCLHADGPANDMRSLDNQQFWYTMAFVTGGIQSKLRYSSLYDMIRLIFAQEWSREEMFKVVKDIVASGKAHGELDDFIRTLCEERPDPSERPWPLNVDMYSRHENDNRGLEGAPLQPFSEYLEEYFGITGYKGEPEDEEESEEDEEESEEDEDEDEDEEAERRRESPPRPASAGVALDEDQRRTLNNVVRLLKMRGDGSMLLLSMIPKVYEDYYGQRLTYPGKLTPFLARSPQIVLISARAGFQCACLRMSEEVNLRNLIKAHGGAMLSMDVARSYEAYFGIKFKKNNLSWPSYLLRAPGISVSTGSDGARYLVA